LDLAGERQRAHRKGGGMMARGSDLSGSIARLIATASAMRGGKSKFLTVNYKT
jgi:hypothetical protein